MFNVDLQNKLLLDIAANPGVTKDKEKINPLHYVYQHPARLGNFSVGHGLLCMKEVCEHNIKYINL